MPSPFRSAGRANGTPCANRGRRLDVRSQDPRPGIRVLGQFARQDWFLALVPASRSRKVDYITRGPLDDSGSQAWMTRFQTQDGPGRASAPSTTRWEEMTFVSTSATDTIRSEVGNRQLSPEREHTCGRGRATECLTSSSRNFGTSRRSINSLALSLGGVRVNGRSCDAPPVVTQQSDIGHHNRPALWIAGEELDATSSSPIDRAKTNYNYDDILRVREEEQGAKRAANDQGPAPVGWDAWSQAARLTGRRPATSARRRML